MQYIINVNRLSEHDIKDLVTVWMMLIPGYMEVYNGTRTLSGLRGDMVLDFPNIEHVTKYCNIFNNAMRKGYIKLIFNDGLDFYVSHNGVKSITSEEDISSEYIYAFPGRWRRFKSWIIKWAGYVK